MRIFFKTTEDPGLQGDFQEVTMLIGLRTLLGDSVIDFPRKKVMYGEWDDSPKHLLHGRGFTYFNRPIPDISTRSLEPTKQDVLLYGIVDQYGEKEDLELNDRFGAVFYLDGSDDPMMRRTKHYFKRELYAPSHASIAGWCFPTGLGFPRSEIRTPTLALKDQLYAKTYPRASLFEPHDERGGRHYIYDRVEDYYDDIARSWFSLTCMKGGWDQLRHLEAVAMGTVVLWRDYDLKPPLCSPQGFPAVSYHTRDEAFAIMDRLVPNGRPTSEYLRILRAQRAWLFEVGTCEQRAASLLRVIETLVSIELQQEVSDGSGADPASG